MKSNLLQNGGRERTMALIFETGDEAIQGLESFAAANRLSASQFTAIGAFSGATVAYFDWERKDYKHIPVDEQVEVLVREPRLRHRPGSAGVRALHAITEFPLTSERTDPWLTP